jgi:hypothetical protein
MLRFPSLLLFAALLLSWRPIAAQSAQRWSLQASGLYVGVSGDVYEGLDAGGGAEVQGRYTPGVWSIGVGVQASSHPVREAGLETETLSLRGAFVEPRRVFDLGWSRAAPYASLRLAWLEQAIDVRVDGTTLSATASGTQINGGGGLLVRLSPRVNLDVGATYGSIRFADGTLTVDGVGTSTLEGTGGSGGNLVMRVGLAIGF